MILCIRLGASMAIKLTVMGSSGVGKTSLAERISAALDLPFLPEIGRLLCRELGFERIGDIPEQEKFKTLALERQIEDEAQFDSFVADRSAIDCWVLWQRWNICTAMTYDTEALYDSVLKHASSYTHIVYIPPMFAASEDGFRWTEPDYIKQIDRIIRMTLYDLDLWHRVLTIRESDLEERIKEVERWLEQEKS